MILDCTLDVSHQEQTILIIQYVDISISPIKIEYFLEFLNLHDTSRCKLFNELQFVLISLDLNIPNVKGQGYDNGSNMKGKHQCVQKRLLEINPWALYMSCACHCFNLTIFYMAYSCVKAISFFGVIQRIYSLFFNFRK